MNEPISRGLFKEFPSELILEIVARMIPEDVITAINFHPEGMQRFPGKIRCFCPVHKERVIRTMTIDILKKTFNCRYARCEAFKGGHLLELYVLTTKCTPREAVEYWAKRLGVNNIPPEESAEPQPAEPPVLTEEVEEVHEEPQEPRPKRPKPEDSTVKYTVDDLLKMGQTTETEEQETPPEGFEDFVRADEFLHLFPTVEEILFNADVLKKEVVATVLAGMSDKALATLKEAFEKARAEGNIEVLQMTRTLLDAHFPDENELREALIALELEREGEHSIPAVLEAVKIQRDLGQLDSALNILKKAFQASPEDPRVLSAIADLYVARQDTVKANEFYRRLATVYVESDLLGNAIGAYRSALNLDPTSSDLHRHLGDLYLSKGMLSEGMDEMMSVGDLLQTENRPEEAEEVYLKVLDLDPSNADTLQKLAVLYRREGEREKLESTYLSLGTVYEKQGLIGRAIKIYKGALHIVAESPPLLQRLAKAHSDKGDDEEAAKAYSHLLELDPENAEARDFIASFAPRVQKVSAAKTGPSAGQLIQEANLRMTESKPEEAEKAYRQAITLEPGNVSYRLALVHLLMDQKKSLQAFNELAKIEGSGDEVRQSKELLLQVGQDLMKAERGEREELSDESLQDQMVNTATELAREYQTTGFYGKAIQTLTLLRNLYPKDTRVLESLADFHAEAGSTDRLAETAEALANLYRELDLLENVSDAYERLLSVDPGNLFALEHLLEWERERQSVHGIYQITITYIGSLMSKGLIGRATDLCRRSVREQIGLLESSETEQEKKNALARAVQLTGRLRELNKDRGDEQEEIDDQVYVARSLMELGFPDSAVDLLGETIEAHPDSPEVLEVFAGSHRALGNKEESIEHLAHLVEILDTGSPLIDEKTSERLDNAYKAILDVDPNAVWAEENLARFYQRTGRTEEAVNALRHLTSVAEAKKDSTREMIARRQLADIEPENVENLKRLKDLVLHKGDKETAEDILKRLLILVTCGKPDPAVAPQECVSILEDLVEIDERNIQYRAQLAESHMAAGKKEEASECWSDLCSLALEVGRHDLAERSYRERVSIDPDNAEILGEFAQFRLSIGQTKEALDLLISTATRHLTEGEVNNAVGDLQKVLEVDPWHRAALAMLLEAANTTKLPESSVKKWIDQGIASAEKVLEEDAAEEALVLIEKVLHLAADNTDALRIQASALEKAGKPIEAIGVWKTLASTAFDDESYGSSAEFFAKVLALAADDTESIGKYIRCLIRSGRREEAVNASLGFLRDFEKESSWKKLVEVVENAGLSEIEDGALIDTLSEYLIAAEENWPGKSVPLNVTGMTARVLSKEMEILDERDMSKPEICQRALRTAAYVIKRHPDNGEALLLLGKATKGAEQNEYLLRAAEVYVSSKDQDRVREALDRMGDLKSLPTECQLRLVDVLMFLGAKNQLRELQESLAEQMIALGEADEAIIQLSALAEEYPREAGYLEKIFELQKVGKQTKEALQTATSISRIWEEQGNLSLSVSWQRKSLYINDSGEEWPEFMTHAFSTSNLESRSVEEVVSAIERLSGLFDVAGKNVEKRSVLNEAAENLKALKQYDLALEFLRRLRDTGFDEISVLERTADIKMLSKDPDAAAVDFMEAGRIAQESNQTPRSDALYRRSIEALETIDPASTKGAWISLTKIWFARNRVEEALGCVADACDFFLQHSISDKIPGFVEDLATDVHEKGALYQGLYDYFSMIAKAEKTESSEALASAREYACRAAEIYVNENWPTKAERLYQQVLEEDIGARDIAQRLVELYRRRGMEREGLEVCLAFYERAQKAKEERALQEFYLDMASSLESESPLVLKKRIGFFQESAAEGDSSYSEPLAKTRCLLAARYFSENDLSGASALVAEVLRDTPNYPDALALEKKLKQREASIAPQKAKAEDLTEAESMLKKGKAEEARNLFEAILSKDPNDLRAIEGLGVSLVQSKRENEGFSFYVEKGKMFLEQHLLPLAQRCLELAKELKPEELETYEVLAEVFSKMGYRDKGLQEYQAMVSAAEQQSPDRVLEAIDKVLSVDPENTRLLEKKATLVEAEPAQAIWRNLADLAHDRLEFDKEVEYLGKTLEALPSDDRTTIGLLYRAARLHIQGNREVQAAEVLERAIAIGEKNELWEDLCDGFHIAFSQESLAQRWKNESGLLAFGKACERCGRVQEALQAYRELLSELEKQDKPEQMLTVCESILNLSPEDIPVLETAVTASEKAEEEPDRRKYLKQLLSLQKSKRLIGRAEQSARQLHESLLSSLEGAPKKERPQIASETVDSAKEVVQLLRERGQDRQVPQYLSASAERMLAADSAREAEVLYREILSLFPDHVATLVSLISIYEGQKKVPEAIQTCGQIINIIQGVRNPTDTDLEILDSTYEKIISLGTDDAKLVLEYANRCRQAKQNETASLYYKESLRLIPQEEAELRLQVLEQLADLERKDLTILLEKAKLEEQTDRRQKAVQTRQTLAEVMAASSVEDSEQIENLERIISLDPEAAECRIRLVDLYLATGKPESAVKNLLALIEQYESAGDLDHSIEYCQKAVEAETDNRDLQEKLAELYEKANEKTKAVEIRLRIAETLGTDQAKEEFLQVLRVDPWNKDALLALARMSTTDDKDLLTEWLPRLSQMATSLADKGDWAEAKDIWEVVLEKDPENLSTLSHLAEVQKSLGETEEALHLIERLVDKQVQNGNDTEAIRNIQEILTIKPDDAEMETLLANLYARVGEVREAVKHYLQAGDLLEDHEAVSRFERAVALAPENLIAQRKLINALETQKQSSEIQAKILESRHYLLRHLTAQPKTADSVHEIRSVAGQILKKIPTDTLALESLANSWRDEDEDKRTTLILQLAQIEAAKGETEKALLTLREVERTTSISSQNRKVLFELLEKLGRTDDVLKQRVAYVDHLLAEEEEDAAAKQLSSIISRFPDQNDLRVRLFNLLKDLGRQTEARKHALEISQYFRKQGDFNASAKWLEEALLVEHAKGVSQSISEFLQNQEFSRNEHELLTELADIYAASGRHSNAQVALLSVARDLEAAEVFDKAQEVLQHAIDLKKDNPEAWAILFTLYDRQRNSTGAAEMALNLARHHRRLGERQEAEQWFERSLDECPSLSVREELAEMLWSTGSRQAALEELESCANGYLAEDSVDKAVQLCEKYLAEEVGNTQILALLSEIYRKTGQKEARVKTMLDAAESWRQKEFLSKAQALYEQVIDIDPANIDAHESLISIYSERGLVQETIQKCLALAEVFTSMEDPSLWDRIEQNYKRILLLDKHNIAAAQGLTALLHRQIEQAVEENLIEAADERRLSLGQVMAGMALNFLRQNDLPRAEDVLAELKEIAPSNKDISRIEEEIRTRREALLPQNALLDMLTKAKQQSAKGYKDQALEIYEEILSRESLNISAIVGLSELLQETGKSEEAVSLLKAKGEHFIEYGLFDPAQVCLDAAVKMAPLDPEIKESFAKACSGLGAREKAAAMLVEAAEMYEQDSPEKAISSLKEAAAISPDDVEIQVRMASLNGKLSRFDEALSLYLSASDQYLDRKRPDLAASVLETLVKTAPPEDVEVSLEVRIRLAGLLFDLDRLERASRMSAEVAEKAFENGLWDSVRLALELLFENPNVNPAYLTLERKEHLAEAYRRTGAFHKAVEQFSALAEELVAKGDLDEALGVYERVAAMSPEDLIPIERIYEISYQIGQVEKSLEMGIKLASAFARKGLLGKADVLYQQIMNRERQCKELKESVYEAAARFYLDKGDGSQAVEALLNLASRHEQLDQPEGEERTYRRVLELNQDDGRTLTAYQLLARLLEVQGKLNDSIEVYRQLAEQHRTREDFANFISVYNHIVRLMPEEESHYETLTKAYLHSHLTSEAVAFYESLVSDMEQDRNWQAALLALTQLSSLRPEATGYQQREIQILHESGEKELAARKSLETAKRQSESGEYERAITTLEQMLQLQPENQKVQNFLSSIRLEMDTQKRETDRQHLLSEASRRQAKGDVDGAIEALEKCRQYGLSDLSLLDNLARLYAEKAASGSPENGEKAIELYYQLAEKASKNLDFDAACSYFKRASAIEPERPGLLNSLAKAYLDAGQTQRASDTYANLAEIYRAQNQPEALEDAYRKILAFEPDNLIVRGKLGELLARQNSADEAIEQFWIQTQEYEKREVYNKAITSLKRILELRPEHIPAKRRLAQLYLSKGDARTSLDLEKEIVRLFLQSGKTEEAINEFQTALEVDPENAGIREELADLYAHLGRPEEALAQRLALLDIYQEREVIGQVIQVCENILKDNPSMKEISEQLIRSLLESGQIPKAIEELLRMGALLEKDEPEYCIEIFKKILNLDTENLRAHQGMIRIYRRQRDKEKAFKHLVIAGDLLRKKAEHHRAAQAYWQALQMETRDESVYTRLAECQEHLGEQEHAWRTLEDRADVLAISGRDREAVREYLRLADLYLMEESAD